MRQAFFSFFWSVGEKKGIYFTPKILGFIKQRKTSLWDRSVCVYSPIVQREEVARETEAPEGWVLRALRGGERHQVLRSVRGR